MESLRGPNASLKEELLRLLERQARIETSDFLGTIPKLGDSAPTTAPTAVPAGTSVGPYVIEQEIGRGGMGIVYRAHRADGLIKRPVALKLLQPGLASAEILGRFARERDILASLTHPNIARLYDAGSTDTGQPFIALEYVEGLSLIDFCDGKRLGLRERLRLLVQILRAVQCAHTNLVIHRDLKPSNILVTATGEVRLLDFGIAKPLREQGDGATGVTQFGGRVLTPDYAAPEQLLGHAVSTASDVYSLGVVMLTCIPTVLTSIRTTGGPAAAFTPWLPSTRQKTQVRPAPNGRRVMKTQASTSADAHPRRCLTDRYAKGAAGQESAFRRYRPRPGSADP